MMTFFNISSAFEDCANIYEYISVQYILNCLFSQAVTYISSILEHFVIFCVAYFCLCVLLSKLLNYGYSLRYERCLRPSNRVLIVIAHPDDEAMFFGPLIYKLCKQQNTKVFLLCLSKGNKQNLGKIRQKELWNSCLKLGIDSSNIILYNCTLFKDDEKTKWRTDLLAKIILKYIESLQIDALVTFDKNGVSKHMNHTSIYYAVAYLSIEKMLPNYCKIYTLESINILRKYWQFLDIPLSFILSTHRYILKNNEKQIILSAMKEHKSQFVWFRKLYVVFSRYMLINTFTQLDLIDLELDLTLDD